jgi:transcriptional regulator with XRE-family HTH domain
VVRDRQGRSTARTSRRGQLCNSLLFSTLQLAVRCAGGLLISSMPNAIRKRRLKRGLTQEQVAAQIGTTKIQLSRWERSWDEVPVAVVKDLAILLRCSSEDILGRTIDPEEWRESPYAIGGYEELYGVLELHLASGEYSYPFGESSAKKLERLLGRREIGQCEEATGWLVTGALNNLMLFVNPRHLIQANIDRDTLVPHYSHPEVYRAMQSWEDEDQEFGPILKAACEAHVAELGEEAALDLFHYRIKFADGSERRVEMDEWALMTIFTLEAHSFSVEPGAMLDFLDDERDVQSWVNLDHVALIEVPEDDYFRLMAPEPERRRGANDR